MKVKPHITFITITLTVLAIPVITFNRKGTTAVRENRMRAVWEGCRQAFRMLVLAIR